MSALYFFSENLRDSSRDITKHSSNEHRVEIYEIEGEVRLRFDNAEVVFDEDNAKEFLKGFNEATKRANF